jgi:hypothetical protein
MLMYVIKIIKRKQRHNFIKTKNNFYGKRNNRNNLQD